MNFRSVPERSDVTLRCRDDAVAVAVAARSHGVLDLVGHPVAVGVGVARIPDPVLVEIRLVRVEDERAVVDRVGLAVMVPVALVPGW